MAAIDDILNWEWPKDCNAQGGAILALLGLLNDLQNEWAAILPAVLQINQSVEPTPADWEALWLAEGNALPIPDGARLLWYSTESAIFGGLYGVVNGNIVRIENQFYAGKSDFIPHRISDYTDIRFVVDGTLVELGNPVTFTLQRPAKLAIRLQTTQTEQATATAAIYYNKISYTLNGVYQIVNPVDTLPGLLLCEQNTSSVTPSEIQGHSSGLEWVHPEVLLPGTYTIAFYALTTTYPTERYLSWGAKPLPIVSPANVNSGYYRFTPPAYSWEITYQ